MLRLLGDGSGDSEGLDWIVHKSYEVAAVRAWLDWLDRRRSEWDILELNTLPAESPVAQILQEEFRQRGWRYWQRANPHLVLVLPDSWESYLGSLSKKRRYSVLSRNFHFELPLHPKTYASYPVVSIANRPGLFEVVVRHILAVLRSRCAGFACPACLAADTCPARPLLST